MTTIGFIGTGNMAQAIATKLANQPQYQLLAYSPTPHHLKHFCEQFNATSTQSNRELVIKSDIIILAVKPQMMTSLLIEIQSSISQQLVITIAAGLTLDYYHQYLPYYPVIRVMPNINATISQSMTALSTKYASPTQMLQAQVIFNHIGKTIELAEDKFSIFTALAGSAPAYIFLLIDTLAKAGVKHGLPKQLATDIVSQMVLGSADLIQQQQQHPQQLIDQVCSPGGTTIAGYCSLEETNFSHSLIKAIDAVIERDQQLSNNK